MKNIQIQRSTMRVTAFFLFLIISLFYVLIITEKTAAQVPTAGLVGHWTLDEDVGSTAFDSAGANNGLLINNPARVVGKVGNALDFDGGTDEVVQIPDTNVLDLTNDYTMSAWIYPRSFGQNDESRIFDKGGASGGSGTGWMLGINSTNVCGNKLTYRVSHNTNSKILCGTNNAVVLNQWRLITVSYSNGTATGYVNGVFDAQKTGMPDVNANAHDPRIGMRATDFNREFDGYIDDVRIYNRALSASEVAELYSSTSGGGSPDTEPPSVPNGLSANAVSSSQINLSWNASVDNVAVTGYKIYRDSTQIGAVTGTSYIDAGLSASTTYSYQVSAFDGAGNDSADSVSASATTNSSSAITPTGLIKVFDGQTQNGFYTWLENSGYNDPLNVFSVQNGELRISGEDFGGVFSDNMYENYHLIIEFKWGDETFSPRVTKAKDSGIMLHAQGKDGGSTGGLAGRWKSALQAQIIEGGMGDIILNQGVDETDQLIPQSMTINTELVDCLQNNWGCWTLGGSANQPWTGSKTHKYKSSSPATTFTQWDLIHHNNWDPNWVDVIGYRGAGDYENPNGEWNQFAIIADGDTVTIYFNGIKVNEAKNVSPRFGQILIQSEKAELFVRKWELWPVGQAPAPVNPEDVDTTAPTLSNISAGNITQTSADISWNTDEDSDSQVEYGLTMSYGNQTALNPTLTASHVVNLSGLQSGATYHYRVKSVDSSGNLAVSLDRTFTTLGVPDTQEPNPVTDLSVSSVTENSALLSFTSPPDLPSGGIVSSYDVRYSTSPITESNWASAIQATGEPSPATPSTLQSYTLAGLDSSTTYYTVIKSSDSASNVSDISNVVSFTTSEAPDTTAPTLSNISAGNITQTSADISWNTDEDSDSQVEYGLTMSYGNQTALSSILASAHFHQLNGLTASTTYHYRVKSQDGAGNLAVSADQVFITQPIPDVTAPANVTNLSAGNVSENSADFSWTAPGDDGNIGTASTYEIRFSTSVITSSNFSSAILVANPPVPQTAGSLENITIGSLLPSTNYYIALKTHDEVGNTSSMSNVVSLTTQPPAPADTTPPIITNALASGTAKNASITWNTDEPATSEVSYGLDQSLSDGTVTSAVLVTSHSLQITGLRKRKIYYYEVRSTDASGNKATSGILSFETGTGKTASVKNLQAQNGSVVLSWGVPEDEFAEKIEIYRSFVDYPTHGKTDQLIATLGAGQTKYKDTNTIVGTKYYYSLFVIDDKGMISDPSHISYTTMDGLSEGGVATADVSPTRFSAYGVADQVVLSWKNPTQSQFVRAKVIRKINSAPTKESDGEVVFEGTESKFIDKNVVAGQRYYYAIFGLDQSLQPNGLSISQATLGNHTEEEVVNSLSQIENESSVKSLRVREVSDVPAYNFARRLALQTRDGDVKKLQHALNSLGFSVALTGPGSLGNETEYFGPATMSALKRFQVANAIVSSGSPETTGYGNFGPSTRAKLNALLVDNLGHASSSIGAHVSTKKVSGYTFSRNLNRDKQGEDVMELQKLLNRLGIKVAELGPGSPGNETDYFGPATREAVVRFQNTYASEVLIPVGLSQGNGFVGPSTRAKLNSMVK